MKRMAATYEKKKKDRKGHINNINRSILNSSNLVTPSLDQNSVDVIFLKSGWHIKTIKHLKKALKLAPDNRPLA